ncbi:uncharacterized protein HMPREF1541_10678 [Cyphellophora europaea CBS 101466]|uniref:Uncharacterized protein n=1 Tax=Cyphellophora europaea (strain CBS 101466) TaxID=1220924 RepID=W2S7V3_CYPE1|nr:uncharacterized protein HMPREF1541_10678 [Cyphellophora europaea CBS 101466]ETN44128.1 hypothetical protein HMPREF1541_10678 [Cyphellophora europaea CBS 101466]
MSFNNTLPSCKDAPETALSDAGVAGAGILLAFIITAGLALIFSSFIVFSEIRGRSSRNISRKILSGLSDQMIVEGIAIQVVGLARVNSMIPYHFFIIWMLAILSTATNFATLLALVQDFKRDWLLRWLRQFAMFVNLVLTTVFGIFVLQTNMRNLSPTLPIACVWQEHATGESGRSNSAVSVAGTIAVIAASCIIFVLSTWYLHMPKLVWGKVVRVVCLIVLMAIAIGAAARVIIISQAFGSPSVDLSDRGEKQWTFGQLLTMLLLLLPFVSALEIFRGTLAHHTRKAIAQELTKLRRDGGPTGECWR